MVSVLAFTSVIRLIMSGGLHLETLAEAFTSGTLASKGGGIVCLCTPGKCSISKAESPDGGPELRSISLRIKRSNEAC